MTRRGGVEVRVLVLEPEYCPYTASFKDEAEAVRKTIEGKCQMLLPFGNTVIALICSEVQDGLPLNRSINEQLTLKGRALICGWDGQRLRELTRKQAERYSRRYLYPEQLVDAGDALMAVPQSPRIKPIDERLGRKNWLLER